MRTTTSSLPGLAGHGDAAIAVIIAGVADYKVSADPSAHIVTYALGSCLGITFHDARRNIGGLLHAMLPDSRLHRGECLRGAMFIDTGVPLVLDAMKRLGACRADIRCKVFGGAQIMSADHFFKIGQKNLEAFSALSREFDLDVVAWESGGCVNRTIRLLNSTGDVIVKVPARPDFIR
jgi:chemotaxis protein CheD